MAAAGSGLYVQFGCGLSAPDGWHNYDSSPTLRLQKMPVVGALLPASRRIFPDAVKLGDIVKGLPVANQSVDGLYASHVLEHLSLADCRTALKHAFRLLKPGGIFRAIVPDLKGRAALYLSAAEAEDPSAAHAFMRGAYLGQEAPATSLKARLRRAMGNADHLWMWDYPAMAAEFESAGFTSVRRAAFGDASDPMFAKVEDETRFTDETLNLPECAIEGVRP